MFDFTAIQSGTASLFLVFLYGLVTSIHCVGMCGGFVISGTFGSSLDDMHTQRSNKSFVLPVALARRAFGYNAGRLVSYTIVGMFAGGFGRFIALTGLVRAAIPFFGGLLVLFLGLENSGLLRVFRVRLPSLPSSWLDRLPQSLFLLGLASGFFPCGPLQAMQFYALGSGGFAEGGLAMLVFTIGTVPLLFGLAMSGSTIPPRLIAFARRISGVVLLLMGLSMMSRGVVLSGFRVDLSALLNSGTRSLTAIPRGKSQLIVANFTTKYYPELHVRTGVPVRWIIVLKKEDVGECVATIDVPEFGIYATLHEGENIFEFTPKKSGSFPYHSWCGMMSSKIIASDMDHPR